MTPAASCPARLPTYPSGRRFDAARPDVAADVLYVVGGLYGNLAALDAVERLAAQADARPDGRVQRRLPLVRRRAGLVRRDRARRRAPSCACAATSRPRSRAPTTSAPAAAAPIPIRAARTSCSARTKSWRAARRAIRGARARAPRGLPMHLVAQVGALARRHRARRRRLARRLALRAGGARRSGASRPGSPRSRRAAQVDVFASTHTCLAALRDFALPAGRLTVINNGAAGMPNFAGTRLRRDHRASPTAPSRIRRSTACSATACSSTRIAVALRPARVSRSLPDALAGSARPAHMSYYQRIVARAGLSPWRSASPTRSAMHTLHHHAGARRGRRDRGGLDGAGAVIARAASR